jgi:hypothetical protein
MIRRPFVFLLTAALGLSTFALAHANDMAGMSPKGKGTTITGEVVDTGCYLGHAARGEKHIGCATKCVNNGMPMGLLTADGRLYLLTLNHDDADPYNQLKGMLGKNAAVTGVVMQRAGMKAIDVTGARLAAAVPAAKK